MKTMRNTSELKFNPIRFALCGLNGSVGSRGNASNFFRSPLSQNIEYAVWKEAKTVNQIADDLGVSPVYVESEVEYLETYGFLTKHGDKYLCNILIEEPSAELHQLQDEMYEKTAKIFANELFDTLTNAEVWGDSRIFAGGIGTAEVDSLKDKNFLLWALIPYIAALSGEKLMDSSISFEEAATLRPDGGQNICYATVLNEGAQPPKYFDSMQKNFCGPCWNQVNDLTLWQVDSPWSGRRVDDSYPAEARRILTLLRRYIDGENLSKDEYAHLAEAGFLKRTKSRDDAFKFALQCVWIDGADAKAALLAFGDRIKEKHFEEFEAMRKPYVDAVLRETPKQLRTMRKYGMQYIFYSDGWFVLHCLMELVNSGKLKPPTEEQKKSLSVLVIRE